MSTTERVYGVEAESIYKKTNSIKYSIIPCNLTGEMPALFIKEDLVVLDRPACETDKTYRHFATYVIIQDAEGKILTYPRAKGSTEERLHGNWSVGIGGHITVKNCDALDSLESIFSEAIIRELEEELGYEYNEKYTSSMSSDIRELVFSSQSGYSYLLDNTNEVGKRHIAITLRLTLTPQLKNVINVNKEVTELHWLTIEELKSGYRKLESWSEILINNITAIKGNIAPEIAFYGEKPFDYPDKVVVPFDSE